MTATTTKTSTRKRSPWRDTGKTFVDQNGLVLHIQELGVEYPGMCLGERTKHQYPYSYDPHLQWSKQVGVPQDARGEYSDRLHQWEPQKFKALCMKHFAGKRGDPGGQMFHSRTPKDIEAFLRDYFDRPQLELLRVEEHCNQATGYPVWVFYHR